MKTRLRIDEPGQAHLAGMDMPSPVSPWPLGEATLGSQVRACDQTDGEVQGRREAMAARHLDHRILDSTVAPWREAVAGPNLSGSHGRTQIVGRRTERDSR